MAHQSRLCGVFFDTPDAAASVAFWSAALGRSRRPTDTEDGPYFGLESREGDGMDVVVQKIDGEPRAHVDIETDDVKAEVTRLIALGAEMVDAVEDWHVLRALVGIWSVSSRLIRLPGLMGVSSGPRDSYVIERYLQLMTLHAMQEGLLHDVHIAVHTRTGQRQV